MSDFRAFYMSQSLIISSCIQLLSKICAGGAGAQKSMIEQRYNILYVDIYISYCFLFSVKFVSGGVGRAPNSLIDI